MKLCNKIILGMSLFFLTIFFGGCGAIKDPFRNDSNTESVVEVESRTKDTYTQESLVDAEKAETEFFAMDTYMSLVAYGDKAQEAIDAAEQEIMRLDELLSTGNPESEISILNANGKTVVSEDTQYLINSALDLYEETKGIFNIAIYPIMDLWGFTTKNYSIPSTDQIKERLALTDASKIESDLNSMQISFLQSGMQIDLGGIAKGYASSRVMALFENYNIQSGMINLGGNVHVYHSKIDGTPWRVAIQDPYGSSEYLGVISATDQAVITSGGYERYFEEDGVKYHHIIDPATGCPADAKMTSVTIISEDGMLADALSTTLFIMGKDQAIEFWKNHSDQFDTVFQCEDGMIYVTEGIAEDFYTEFQVVEVKKE